MFKFKSKYFESRVREKLKIETADLTPDDLSKINGFLLNESSQFKIPVIWYMEISSFKMTRPDLHLDYRELTKEPDWEQDLRLFSLETKLRFQVYLREESHGLRVAVRHRNYEHKTAPDFGQKRERNLYAVTALRVPRKWRL